jgi:hypothetical protein
MKEPGAPTRKYWNEFADIMALLMWQPRTVHEVVSLTEYPTNTVYDKINALHHAGVLRVAGRRFNFPATDKTDRRGTPAKVFAVQAKPFELPDTPEVRLL